MLVSTRARQVYNLCSWQCTNIPCPHSHTVLEADGHVHTVTSLRPFLPFSTHRFLHLFTFARPFFLLPFVPSLFFSSYFSFIPILTRTYFIASNFILLRASSDATISLSVSVFIRLNPHATSCFLYLINLPTPPE